MEVDVQAKGGPKALDGVDGAGGEVLGRYVFGWRCAVGVVAVGAIDKLLARASAIGGIDGPDERSGDASQEGWVAGEGEAKVPGEAQDPLAHGDRREDALHEVGGYLVHTAAAAGGAEAATFTGERDEEIGAAGAALEAGEAVGGVAAAQERVKLFLDVAGEAAAAVVVLEAGEEGREVLAEQGWEGLVCLVPA